MKSSHSFALAFALLAACLNAGASSAVPTPPADLPATLQPPAGTTLTLQAQGSGVQIYLCKSAADDATRFEWALQAPQADLLDNAGKRIGKHYAGPTWQALDGSTVVGEVKAHDNGPDPGAVAWLLLAAKSNSGNGVFGAVRWVQRLNTVGGKAPADGCDAAHAGVQLRVPYKANYYFYSGVS
jgi:hypothetical protein